MTSSKDSDRLTIQFDRAILEDIKDFFEKNFGELPSSEGRIQTSILCFCTGVTDHHIKSWMSNHLTLKKDKAQFQKYFEEGKSQYIKEYGLGEVCRGCRSDLEKFWINLYTQWDYTRKNQTMQGGSLAFLASLDGHHGHEKLKTAIYEGKNFQFQSWHNQFAPYWCYQIQKMFKEWYVKEDFLEGFEFVVHSFQFPHVYFEMVATLGNGGRAVSEAKAAIYLSAFSAYFEHQFPVGFEFCFFLPRDDRDES